MSLIHYEPWSLLDRLAQNSAPQSFVPAVDVFEEQDRYVVRVDLPGVSRDQIEIVAENGVLTLKGERKAAPAKPEDGYSRIERTNGSFVRRFTLPKAAQAESIKATHTNGVLEMIIPKQPKPEPHRIDVQAA
jgi:HSP20 family protein